MLTLYVQYAFDDVGCCNLLMVKKKSSVVMPVSRFKISILFNISLIIYLKFNKIIQIKYFFLISFSLLFSINTGSYLGLTSANGSGFNRSSLVVSRQNFADTAMWHEKLAGNVAWPYPHVSELHYAASDVFREGATVHKDSPQLIDPSLTWG